MKHQIVLNNAECVLETSTGLKLETVSVGVSSGKIAEISSTVLEGQQVLDLKNLTVLPGLIDSQVHFREPGLTHKEDLEAGSRGAALGGVTCFFEMPNTSPPTTTQERFEQKLKLAQNRLWTDYAFFVGGSPENVEQLGALELLPSCSGIKIFMGSSTGSLLVEDDSTLEKIFFTGRRRITLHAEDEALLRTQKKWAIESGDVRNHPVWRSPEVCFKATERLLRLARKTGRLVHVLHVTTAEEMALLRQNKDLATVEVLPQHLTLSAPECYEKLGTKAQQNPPIREKFHQEALWKAVLDGTVDVLGSDHAPHTLTEKNQLYPQSPSGMPGVQTIVPVMLNHVHQKKLSLFRFVELMTNGPIKTFGLKNKGKIKVGFDADFTVVDLHKSMTISNSQMATKSKWTPFDGVQVTGWPVMTIVRGTVVAREGEILGTPAGAPVYFEHLGNSPKNRE